MLYRTSAAQHAHWPPHTKKCSHTHDASCIILITRPTAQSVQNANRGCAVCQGWHDESSGANIDSCSLTNYSAAKPVHMRRLWAHFYSWLLAHFGGWKRPLLLAPGCHLRSLPPRMRLLLLMPLPLSRTILRTSPRQVQQLSATHTVS